MSDEQNKPDTLQPSWAAHELFALGLTVVLALWVVVKYGSQTQPADQGSARAEERAAKLAELKMADAEALGSYGVVDASIKRYRIPINDAITAVVKAGSGDTAGIAKDIVARMEPEIELELVKFPMPPNVADESELDDPALIAQGKALFTSKICFTCHQVDPSIPAPAGLALKAPKYIGDFWGKETLVHKGAGGPLQKVVFGPGYFYDSVKNSAAYVAKGALAPMPPPPPPMTDDNIKALMAYVRSLSKKE